MLAICMVVMMVMVVVVMTVEHRSGRKVFQWELRMRWKEILGFSKKIRGIVYTVERIVLATLNALLWTVIKKKWHQGANRCP